MLEESLKYAALLVIKQGSRMSGRQCTVFQLRAPLCNFQKKKQTNLQTKPWWEVDRVRIGIIHVMQILQTYYFQDDTLHGSLIV